MKNRTPYLEWIREDSEPFQKKVCLHQTQSIDPLQILNSFRLEKSLKEIPQIVSQYNYPQHCNRLIYGDSCKVMYSILERENLENSVKMVYFDPPYGIGYNANFQLRNSILQEKNGVVRKSSVIRAFEDTWKNGIHSYLQYIHDNLILVRKLLCEQGSVFLQIGDENVANVAKILEDIFGSKNKVSLIVIKKTSGFGSMGINNVCDYILWYAKDKSKLQPRQLFCKKNLTTQEILKTYTMIREKDGSLQKILFKKDFCLQKDQKLIRCECIHSEGETSTGSFPVEFEGKIYFPPKGRHWTTHESGMKKLIQLGRISTMGDQICYTRHWNDSPYQGLTNLWSDVGCGFGNKEYAVQTSLKCIQRCMLMSTDPGDLVMDITCGGGTTPVVAEQWARKWIAIDNSSVAIHLTKRRLIYKIFPHYKISSSRNGVQEGFLYRSFPYVTIKSLANQTNIKQQILYDSPFIDKQKIRVSSKFRVETFSQSFVSFSQKKNLEYSKIFLEKGIISVSGDIIEIVSLQEVRSVDIFYLLGKTKSGKFLCFIPYKVVEKNFNFSKLFSNIQADLFIFYGIESDFLDVSKITKYPQTCFMSFKYDGKKYLSKEKSPKSWILGEPIISVIKDSFSRYIVQVNGFYGINAYLCRENFGLNRIMMWMIDLDYDGKNFSPVQSFIPMSCKESWTKVSIKKKDLFIKNISEGCHKGGSSLPFISSEKNLGKIAILLVDDRGKTMFTTLSQQFYLDKQFSK